MDVLQVLRERRSINFFDPHRDVSDSTMDELLELANLAPSSYNLQPWEVIVVNDPEKKKALRKCAFNQIKVEEASAVLIIVANPDGAEENIDNVLATMVQLGYMKEADVQNQRKAVLKKYEEMDIHEREIFAIKNSSFFAMNIMVAAKGLGLESHPMDGFKEDDVKKEFGIPGNRRIPLLLAVGYMREGITLLPRAFRRKLKGFVSYNNF